MAREHRWVTDSTAPSRAPSIGLVLGAGGVAGFAYGVGTLAALGAGTGWDPRSADLIVGTSAGASLGSLLRAGMSASDQYAQSQGGPLSEAGQALLAGAPTTRWDEGELAARSRRRVAPLMATRSLLRWPPRPGLSLAGYRRPGDRSSRPLGDRYRYLLGSWPERHLWICAVRTADGHRVVFGRDDLPEVDVGTAVEASAAVPGSIAPVRIGDATYVDGATWSATNADLAAALGFDALVVVAPLSAARGALRPRSASVPRAYHHAMLGRELAPARAMGTRLVVAEPRAADLDAFGDQRAVDGSRPEIAAQAFATMRARLERDEELARALTEPVPA
jgi:NTE family protein